MTMKKLLFVVLSFLPFLGISQDKTVNINWMEDDAVLYFTNAIYLETSGPIPVYTEVNPWNDPNSVPEIKITIQRYTILQEKYREQISKASLSDAPSVSFQVVFEKKQPMLQLQVTPFFITSDDKVARVESFTLHIGTSEAIGKLKSLKKGEFTASSILASNDWYKIAVKKSGMHKLTYEKLLEAGLENPAMVKIFGTGAIQLPEDYSKGAYDDLSEIPVYMNKGSDQLFGPGDYILFYARGPVTWNYNISADFYSQELHDYAENGYYFITDDLGSASAPAETKLSNNPPAQVVSTFDLLAFHEDETFNLLHSGREWYGDKFEITLSRAYPFNLKNLVTTESLKIRVTAAGRSEEPSAFSIKANNSTLGTLSFNTVNLSSYTSTFAVESNKVFQYNATQEVVTVQLEYLKPNNNSIAWLNHITLNGRAKLDLSANEIVFRDSRSVYFGSVTEFQLKNAGPNTRIWEITEPGNPGNISHDLSGNTASFVLETDTLREFIAFNTGGDYPEPQVQGKGLGKVENQNLHGTTPPEMLIIYAEAFEEQAKRLADHRRNHDDLTVLTVPQGNIFNEFSSGTPDAVAIRNYLKMYYDNYPQEQMTQYLLLFGDGSYDNRDTASANPNLILTYQSVNSLVPTSSYVSDDFYGLLDTGEKLYDGMLDIGIGRLPVSTQDEAELLTDKIIAYDQVETLGEWRNYITLIGDDEDGNIHMRQANNLATLIETNYPGYNINKIYMDAYPQITTPTGDLYPDVTRAINDQMNRGALIVNYTGHGGVTGLAHEKILDVNNIKSWNNKGRYPLFMTATCEFSRYDEYTGSSEVTSAGEDVLLNASGGGIALFTTTRLVYSGPNYVLNEKFFDIVFQKKPDGACYRLGDIIKYSKNNAGAGINKRNFTLLGDPAISLSFPEHVVITDSVNSVSADMYKDTISALDFVTISGHIESQDGALLDNFNGVVTPIVFDKMSNVKSLANDGGTPFEFRNRTNRLYKGNATVQDGRFTFSFYVPKDISYKVGEGKISYYGNSDNTDAHGSSSILTIGGLGDFAGMDTVGPGLKVYMNDSLFRNGGIVTRSPELLVYVRDPFGINTTGNGIGHDITATLNEDRMNAIILNEYYQADRDSYSSGTVRYPYSNLPYGKHTIQVKVWDIFNNSSTRSVDFIVVESMEMLLEEVYNYPNPFVDQTYFNIEHNRPGQELEIMIRIYELSGNLVTVLQDRIYSTGYRIDPPSWQGISMGGATLGSGLYVYKVIVRSEDGEEASGSGRMIINR
ncbi:MAG: type IX secretion system sortase PorU [Bacteroidales bacterium]